ncbi:phospholipase D-like domain-containing protein [Bradyrhizobium cenepequi]
MSHDLLLVPGRNCWRIERSQRLAFLIDGAAYFAAVRSAIAQAQRSVLILGWDFDSRIRLIPTDANDDFPEELGPFLREVVKRRPELHMYVLSWDFVMLYAMDRQWIPLYKLGWRTHPAPRLSFRLDSNYPFGGSHHQKVVVVDDAVAFVGGMDLTHGRWDTPRHRRDEPNRLDARGQQARPYHDVQVAVDGAAALALGELCRDRWQRATGQYPVTVEAVPASDPWPRGLEPDATDLDVAISRTDPGYGSGSGSGQQVEEIRHLYIDAIRAAKRLLYLENQYFSSSALGSALTERLRIENAPEIVVVSRLTEEDWLEEQTMGVLRARLNDQLKDADAYDRYRLLYPYVPNL